MLRADVAIFLIVTLFCIPFTFAAITGGDYAVGTSWSSTTGFSGSDEIGSMSWSPTTVASGGAYSATTGPLVTYTLVSEVVAPSAPASSRGSVAPASNSTTLIVRLGSGQYFLVGRVRYALQLQAIDGKNATIIVSPESFAFSIVEGETRAVTIGDSSVTIALLRVTTDSVTVRIAPTLGINASTRPPIQLPEEQIVTPILPSDGAAQEVPEESLKDKSPILSSVPGEKNALIVVFIIASVVLFVFVLIIFFRRNA